MRTKRGIGLLLLGLAGFVGLLAWLASRGQLAVLHPKGVIAQQQYDLLVLATVLSVVVVVPVFALTFFIVWKYRANNTKATYSPNWDNNHLAEAVWWGVPLLLISVLSVIIWRSSHTLDPFRPLASSRKPLTVQVIAMQWKWLFIYPEQGVAAINELYLPKDTPIAFELTSDAPMNSFWIPNLGGQVYAMSGMTTKLHLMASQPGRYPGMSANISGEGFAGMRFMATVGSDDQFAQWLVAAKQSPRTMDLPAYNKLLTPSKNNPPAVYSHADKTLYDTVRMKYMMPSNQPSNSVEAAHYH